MDISSKIKRVRTKRYKKKSGIRGEAKNREKKRDRETERLRERRESAKQREIERENVEWILIPKYKEVRMYRN